MSNDGGGLSIELRGSIAVLQLCRPERRNAINEALVERIGAFFSSPPSEIAAAVLHGSGEHFCAGLDLVEQRKRSAFETVRVSRLWHSAFAAMELGRVPVVALLKGAVIGGGLELALACHVRVAEPSALYALPEGRLGIFVGGGASMRATRLLGVDRVREMMLTGRRLGAAEGQQLGLSHELVGEGAGLERTLQLADTVASNAPIANFAILQALPRIADMPAEDGLLTESLTAALTQSSEDAAEGLQAFLEKRVPKFHGR
jgi:enoyl-CoA hydratase/carnithine racemase